jgi:hypothetical protein
MFLFMKIKYKRTFKSTKQKGENNQEKYKKGIKLQIRKKRERIEIYGYKKIFEGKIFNF